MENATRNYGYCYSNNWCFFYLYLSGNIQKCKKNNGEALASSIVMGIEGAIQSREKAEDIMEKEMIAESVMAPILLIRVQHMKI